MLDFGRGAAVFPLAAWMPASLQTVLAAGEEGTAPIRRLIRIVEDATDAVSGICPARAR